MGPLGMDDFENICRTCLSGKNKNLNSDENIQLVSLNDLAPHLADNYKLLELLKKTVTELDTHDMLPKNICVKCSCSILDFHRFQIECLKSQKILLDIIAKESVGKELGNEKIQDDEPLDRKKAKDITNNDDAIELNMGKTNIIKSVIKGNDDLLTNSYTRSNEEKENPNEENGEAHYVGRNREIQNLKCPTCNKNFATNYNLRRHMKSHSVKHQSYFCSFCDFTTMFNKKLQKHLLKSHAEYTYKTKNQLRSQFLCNDCGLEFMNTEALSVHQQNHQNAKNANALAKLVNSRYNCPLCGQQFETMHMLNNHKRIHKKGEIQATDAKVPELKPYTCNFCNKSFQQSCTLKEHIRIHTGEQPYLCPDCGKAFRSSSNMSQHLLRHTGILRYECPDCPKKFPCQSDLASHRLIHSKIKRHSCQVCNASFNKPYQLKKHLMYHKGEKPYKCEYCEMRFVCGDHMRRHMRTHTGEKPYKCKYCEKAFAQSNDMIKHLRSHIGENVYRCELCPKSFRLASELRLHFSEHKNDTEETKELNLKALKEEENKLRLLLAEKGIIIAEPLPAVPLDSINKKTHFPKKS